MGVLIVLKSKILKDDKEVEKSPFLIWNDFSIPTKVWFTTSPQNTHKMNVFFGDSCIDASKSIHLCNCK